MRGWLVCVLIAACGGDSDPDVDTEVADTESLGDTQIPSDTDAPSVDDPNGLRETDETDAPLLDPGCSPTEPDGPCVGERECRDGLCIDLLGLDGPPPDDADERWGGYFDWAAPLDLHAPVATISWEEVDNRIRSLLPTMATEAEAWGMMMREVARLRVGHTYVRPPEVCDVDPGYALPESRTGACVAETERGELLVYKVWPETPWSVGEVVLDIDGRGLELLIADREAQPRCGNRPATDEARREAVIATLMASAQPGSTVRVRKRNGAVVTRSITAGLPSMFCQGRVAQDNDVDIGGNVVRTDLEDGVVAFHIPKGGVFDSEPQGPQPTLDAIQDALSGLAPDTPVIFDLRGNPGGYTEVYDTISSWVLGPDQTLRTCFTRRGAEPDQASDEVTRSVDTAFRYGGAVAIVTNGTVYGAPEFLPIAMRLHDAALIVGTPTAASPGVKYNTYEDMGGVVDSLRCDRPDGLRWEGNPPEVDVRVQLSREHALLGRDSLLEAAREALLSVP